MDQADVFVDATAAAKHDGHPWDYSAVATDFIEVLFDIKVCERPERSRFASLR
jgi:hypothetical protein